MNISQYRDYFPANEDLKGSGAALLRLQDTYRLDTKAIADGNIEGTWKSPTLNGMNFNPITPNHSKLKHSNIPCVGLEFRGNLQDGRACTAIAILHEGNEGDCLDAPWSCKKNIKSHGKIYSTVVNYKARQEVLKRTPHQVDTHMLLPQTKYRYPRHAMPYTCL